jgi:hypothetical protein
MEQGSPKAAQRRAERPIEERRARAARFALAVSDPQPVAEVARFWRTAAQSATIGMFTVVLIGALYFGRPILLPVASAFVVAMMLEPLSARAERYQIPSLLSAIVLWLLVIAVFYGVIVLLAAPVVDWIGKAPEIGRNIQEKLHVLDRPLAALQDMRDALLPTDKKGSLGVDIMSFVQPAVLIVTPAIGQTFIFFGTLFFMLLGRSQLRRVLVIFFDERDARLRMLKIMNDTEHNLTGYLSIVAVINVAVGLCGGVGRRPSGSSRLGGAWLYPQFHSLYRRADHGGCVVHGRASDVSDADARVDRAATVPRTCNTGRTFYHAEHNGPQVDAQSAYGFPLAYILDVLVGADLRVSGRAAAHYGAGRD